MHHTTYGEETIEIVNIHARVLVHEGMHSLVIVERVARADELVCPADVLDDLAIVRRASESGDVPLDRL